MSAAREPFVSLNDAAAHLGVSRRSLERYIETYRIPAYRLGRCVRVRLSEVEAALIPMGSAALK